VVASEPPAAPSTVSKDEPDANSYTPGRPTAPSTVVSTEPGSSFVPTVPNQAAP